MKLSQAIREGAKRRPQIFRGFFEFVPETTELGSCAIAAGYEALGGKAEIYAVSSQTMLDFIEEKVDGAGEDYVFSNEHHCPVAGCKYGKDWLNKILEHLNDDHHMSRESQADWLEGLGF
jgi:hypothetical protein